MSDGENEPFLSGPLVRMLLFTPTVHTSSRAHAASHMALKPPTNESTLLVMMKYDDSMSQTTGHYIGYIMLGPIHHMRSIQMGHYTQGRLHTASPSDSLYNEP